MSPARSHVKKFDPYLPPSMVYVGLVLLAIAVFAGQVVWFVNANQTASRLHHHLQDKCNSQTTANCLTYVSAAELSVWLLASFWMVGLVIWPLLAIATFCYQRGSRERQDMNEVFKTVSLALVLLVVLTIGAGLIYITGLFIPEQPERSVLPPTIIASDR